VHFKDKQRIFKFILFVLWFVSFIRSFRVHSVKRKMDKREERGERGRKKEFFGFYSEQFIAAMTRFSCAFSCFIAMRNEKIFVDKKQVVKAPLHVLT
jgi:hypothetical protein